MANPVFRNHLLSRIRTAVEQAKQASAVGHHGLAGQIREIVVEQLLRPILRPTVAIGTGKVTDARGALSDQTDLLVYAPELLPPVLYGGNVGVFPVESTLAVIEVKTTATASEVRQAIASSRKLASEVRHTFVRDGEEWAPGELEKFTRTKATLSALFAFGSDLAEKDELERYKELDIGWETAPAITLLCVVGRGTWAFQQETKAWHHRPPTPDFEEVIFFLSLLDREIPVNLQSRQLQILGFYVSADLLVT